MPTTYRITALTKNQALQTARLATLWKLTKFDKKEELRCVTRALEHLRHMWHGRLQALRLADPRFVTGTGYQYMWSCPPFGVTTDQTDVPTCKHVLCPFCWARRVVVKTWSRVYPAILDEERSTEKRPRYREDVRLVRLAKQWIWERADVKASEIRASLEQSRDWLDQEVKPLGLVQLYTTEARGTSWIVSRRALALMRADAELPQIEGTKQEVPLRLPELRSAVAQTCAYPNGWLHGDIEATLNLLNATRRFRRISYRGEFRLHKR